MSDAFNMSDKKHDESVAQDPSKIEQIYEDQIRSHDAVFGEITGEGPNYRNVRYHILSGALDVAWSTDNTIR